MNPLSRNFRLMVVLRALSSGWLHIPTLLIFYEANGLTFGLVMTLKAALNVIALLLEVPTGYFADRVGRKNSILAGGALCLASFVLYPQWSSFWGFFISEALLAAGFTFIAGADTALMYDSLRALGTESEYTRAEGKLSSVSGLAEASGGLIGGLLAALSLNAPFYGQAVLYFIFLIVAAALCEPPHSAHRKEQPLSGMIPAVRAAFRAEPMLPAVALLTGFLASATLLNVWFAQSYMKSVNIPVAFIGAAWALFHLVFALSSLLSHRFQNSLGSIRTLWIITAIFSCSFFALGLWQDSWGLVLITAIFFGRGLRQPLTRSMINTVTISETRATVLSFSNVIFRLIFSVTSPLLGWLADYTSLSVGFFAVSLLIGVPSGALILSLTRSGWDARERACSRQNDL